MKKKNGRNPNSNNRFKSHHNPKRGPPGILLFCETGREKKCIAEGMDILNHYYNKDNEAFKDDSIIIRGDDGKIDNKESKKIMSLEQEIQMMKKEKKSSPFQVYETGCRGVVFFMCTSKYCNIIVQQPSKSQQKDQLQLEMTKIDENNNDNKEKILQGQTEKTSKDDDNQVNGATAKRKVIIEEDGTGDDNDSSVNQQESKKQKLDDNCDKIWDPIQTIESIVKDIRSNDSTAPM